MRKTYFNKDHVEYFNEGSALETPDGQSDGSVELGGISGGGGADVLGQHDVEGENVPIYQTVGQNDNGERVFDTINYDTRYNGDNKYRHTRTGRAFLKNYVGKDYKAAGEDLQTKLYEGYDPKGLALKVVGKSLGYKVKNIRQWARNLGKSGRQNVLNTYMYRSNGVDSNDEDQNRDVLNSRDKVLTTFGHKFTNMYNNPVLETTLGAYVRGQNIDAETGKFNNPDVYNFRATPKKDDNDALYLADPKLALVDNIDWRNLGIKNFKNHLMKDYYRLAPREQNEKRAKKDLRRQNLRSAFSPIAGMATSGTYVLQAVTQTAGELLGTIINNSINAAGSGLNINMNSRAKVNDDERQEW